MASLAETMFQQASRNVNETAKNSKPDLINAVNVGSQLAQRKEQLQIQREQLDRAKQTLQHQKMNVIGTGVTRMYKLPRSARPAYMKSVLAPQAESVGLPLSETVQKSFLDSDFNPDTLTSDLVQLDAALKSGQGVNPNLEAKLLGIFNGDPEAVATHIRSRQSNIATQELARATLAATQSQRATTNARNVEKDFNQRKKAFTNFFVTKNQIPQLASELNNIDKLIPGGLDKWNGNNIPGVSGTDAAIPLRQLENQTARDIRASAQSVANTILKARSGGAVTPQEATRLLAEIGMSQSADEQGIVQTTFSGLPTSADFVNGMRRVKQKLTEIEASAINTFGKDAFEAATQGVTTLGGPQQKLEANEVPKYTQKQFDDAVQKLVSDPNSLNMDKEKLLEFLRTAPGFTAATIKDLNDIIRQAQAKLGDKNGGK